MSEIGNYRYYANSGRTYQIALPSDFASALGYQAAVETDEYIPASLSPRYATYVSLIGEQWRPVVVCNPDVFRVPPNPVTVDGVNYRLTGLLGERFNLLPGGNLITIAGPQGPRGFTAELDYITAGQPSSVNPPVAGTFSDLFSFGTVPAGTYLCLLSLTASPGGTVATASVQLYNATDASAVGDTETNRLALINNNFQWCVFKELVLATAKSIKVRGTSSNTTTTFLGGSSSFNTFNCKGVLIPKG